MGNQLRRCFSLSDSLWTSLNWLTARTWQLDDRQTAAWAIHNSTGYIYPHEADRVRIQFSKLWFMTHIARFGLYLVLFRSYDEIIEGQRIIKPRFPYYFLDIIQLMSTFTFYGYIAAFANSMLCFLLVRSFDLHWYYRTRKELKWFRLFVLINAMVSSKSRKETQRCYPPLRHIPARIFNKYARLFKEANRMTVRGLKVNALCSFVGLIVTMVEVYLHPEWEVPFVFSIIGSFVCITWYHSDVAICQSLVLLFFLLCLYIVMQTETLISQVKTRRRYRGFSKHSHPPQLNACQVSTQYSAIWFSIADINRFWHGKYGFYCLFYFPTVLTCFYLLLFVPTNLTLTLILSFISIAMFGSFNSMSLTAGKINANSLTLHGQIYFSRLQFCTSSNWKTKFKLINILEASSSKTHTIGIKIGPIGTVDRNTSFKLILLMARFFLLTIKFAPYQNHN